jgi:hypothetical protein
MWFVESFLNHKSFPFDFGNFLYDCFFTSVAIIFFFIFQLAIICLIAEEERKIVSEMQRNRHSLLLG